MTIHTNSPNQIVRPACWSGFPLQTQFACVIFAQIYTVDSKYSSWCQAYLYIEYLAQNWLVRTTPTLKAEPLLGKFRLGKMVIQAAQMNAHEMISTTQ